MEFNEKLQELRKQKGLTQEELAQSLYVSRTAISKWESGRGYPNIDSLKNIAKFFGLTIDELLSGEELLTVAEENTKQDKNHFRSLVYGLLDLSMAMLFFLPFFAEKSNGTVQSTALISLAGIQLYLKATYCAVIFATVIIGVLTLALQNCHAELWLKSQTPISLTLNLALLMLFIVSLQPYAAVFSLAPLAIKALLLIKRQ